MTEHHGGPIGRPPGPRRGTRPRTGTAFAAVAVVAAVAALAMLAASFVHRYLAGGTGGKECDDPSAGPSAAAWRAPHDGPVLRFHTVSGMAGYPAGRAPDTSVYADGRVVLGPSYAGGRADPGLKLLRLTPADVRELTARARALGMAKPCRYKSPENITDMPSESFDLAVDGTWRRTVVEFPSSGADGGGVRGRLADFAEALSADALGRRAAGAETDYRPDGYAALSSASTSTSDSGSREKRWPYGRLTANGCTVLTPAQEKEVRDGTGTGMWTRWRSGDAVYAVGLAPLLPGERTCADFALRNRP